MEHVQQEMENLHSDMNALQQELTTERQQGRGRHAHLVETLTSALQARDAALGALKRLEEHCTQRGLDIANLAVYEVRDLLSFLSKHYAFVLMSTSAIVYFAELEGGHGEPERCHASV